MQYWYPVRSRAQELSEELRRLEGIADHALADETAALEFVSCTLLEVSRRNHFPGHQLPRWTWVASVLRLHAPQRNQIATKCCAAIIYLSKALGSGPLDEPKIQELNWVLDSTVGKLSQLLETNELRGYLSPAEILSIGRRLLHFLEHPSFDFDSVRAAVSQRKEIMAGFGRLGLGTTLNEKIDALFSAAASRTDGTKVAAQAALLYIAENDDVIDDRLGVLGLVDDIYVIEWAYAAVEKHTQLLPLLQAFLQGWPFVADLALMNGGNRHLDRYSQYVACACLYSLFRQSQSSTLVLREVGAYGLIAALLTAVQCARRQAERLEKSIGSWSAGQPIIISDGVDKFKATYLGAMSIAGSPKVRIGVDGPGTITMDPGILPYLASSAEHSKLSTGKQIQSWFKDRHVDPLVHVTGVSRQIPKDQECILLLGPKQKLDRYLPHLQLLGSSPAALFGIKYVSSHFGVSDLPHSATDTPFIYACSDADTAFDLIREPPGHVAKWSVIADGARLGRALSASLASEAEFAGQPILVLAELKEREATSELVSRDSSVVWYLEDSDVEVPPLAPVRVSAEVDSLDRFLSRQANHWSASMGFVDYNDEFLEGLAGCFKDRASKTDSDSGLLDYSLSAFVQKAIAHPLRDEALNSELLLQAETLAAQASVMRQYEASAGRLFELLTAFSSGKKSISDRSAELRLIGKTAETDSVVVVCRSKAVAERTEAAASEFPELRSFRWSTIEQVREGAPFDRVVVPGWLDRLSMRDLVLNGYGSRTDFVLLPFERRWLDATSAAVRKWERKLEAGSIKVLKQIDNEIPKAETDGLMWELFDNKIRTARPSTDSEQDTSDDETEIERLEARMVDAVKLQAAQHQEHEPIAKAQLVMFEEPGVYAYFPPGGKVIVLSKFEAAAETNAEKLLFRNVSELVQGMTVALELSDDRDLVDAWADRFVSSASKVRSTAALWKTALRRHLETNHKDYEVFAEELRRAGVGRHPATVRSWVSDTNTIAPRNFRVAIPIIAELVGDNELSQKCKDVLQSIDLIYRARAEAAKAIVHEIFSGDIDLDSNELRLDLDGTTLEFALQRVRKVGGLDEVPIEIIGKLRKLPLLDGQPIHLQ